MMEAISLGMLKTTGAVDLDQIDSLTVDEKMNEQTEAIIIGRMKPEHLNELQKKNIIGQLFFPPIKYSRRSICLFSSNTLSITIAFLSNIPIAIAGFVVFDTG